eukprot:766122-Hanusia_phi.AAC.5
MREQSGRREERNARKSEGRRGRKREERRGGERARGGCVSKRLADVWHRSGFNRSGTFRPVFYAQYSLGCLLSDGSLSVDQGDCCSLLSLLLVSSRPLRPHSLLRPPRVWSSLRPRRMSPLLQHQVKGEGQGEQEQEQGLDLDLDPLSLVSPNLATWPGSTRSTPGGPRPAEDLGRTSGELGSGSLSLPGAGHPGRHRSVNKFFSPPGRAARYVSLRGLPPFLRHLTVSRQPRAL